MNTPYIKAAFEVDDKGLPIRHEYGGLNHYSIRLSVQDAPETTYAITYMLDETFVNPVREARKDSEFAEEIQTYGDFPVIAKVRTREGIQTVSVRLTEALRETYGAQQSAAITAALTELGEH